MDCTNNTKIENRAKKCFFYFFTRDVQCNKTFLCANRLFILNDQIPIQWLEIDGLRIR